MSTANTGQNNQVTAIKLADNTQKESWFLEINPNGRIPALTDTFTDGKPIRIFESGSILQYLVDRYDPDHKVSYPRGSREYWEVNNWVSCPRASPPFPPFLFDTANSTSFSSSCGRWAAWAPCKGKSTYSPCET